MLMVRRVWRIYSPLALAPAPRYTDSYKREEKTRIVHQRRAKYYNLTASPIIEDSCRPIGAWRITHNKDTKREGPVRGGSDPKFTMKIRVKMVELRSPKPRLRSTLQDLHRCTYTQVPLPSLQYVICMFTHHSSSVMTSDCNIHDWIMVSFSNSYLHAFWNSINCARSSNSFRRFWKLTQPSCNGHSTK